MRVDGESEQGGRRSRSPGSTLRPAPTRRGAAPDQAGILCQNRPWLLSHSGTGKSVIESPGFAPQRAWLRVGQSSQPGFAMALALLATVLIAALLAALFFAVNQETKTGAETAWRDRALAAGESALELEFERLRGPSSERLQIGAAESREVEVDGAPLIVHVTRLDSGLFWLVAGIRSRGDPAAPPRRIGTLAARIRGGSDSISIVRVPGRGWSELF